MHQAIDYRETITGSISSTVTDLPFAKTTSVFCCPGLPSILYIEPFIPREGIRALQFYTSAGKYFDAKNTQKQINRSKSARQRCVRPDLSLFRHDSARKRRDFALGSDNPGNKVSDQTRRIRAEAISSAGPRRRTNSREGELPVKRPLLPGYLSGGADRQERQTDG